MKITFPSPRLFAVFLRFYDLRRNKLLFNKTNRRTRFQIYSCTKLYMFRVVPLPIIRSYLLALAYVVQV